MKRKIYIQISNKTNRMNISCKRKFNALDNGQSYRYSNKKFYPTICIALNLDIPDEFFAKAQKELEIKIKELNINSEIDIKEIENEE